ncbi:MAG: glycosyl transferase family [Geobacteraceae bacterium]|nr:MAG: glycosyl transferase family [Geobacteraceae bacterium]
MKVSVCLTTYNHEKYIAQAIESILSQKTNFQFEIIIGEDDSNDGTRDIVKQYYVNHPDKIRLFLNDRSNVIYIDGKPTGRWNWMNIISQAQGEYLTLLDGDDYWLESDKLQKQVDFLDEHKECSICFHNAIEYREEDDLSRVFLPEDFPQITTLEKLLEYNFIPTCTVMYRRSAIPEFPSWFTKIRMADWPLHILTAQNGNIGLINEVMGCYRQHRHGSWYSITLLQKYLYILKAYEILQQHFNSNSCYKRKIKKLRAKHYLLVANEYNKSKNYIQSFRYKALACIAFI